MSECTEKNKDSLAVPEAHTVSFIVNLLHSWRKYDYTFVVTSEVDKEDLKEGFRNIADSIINGGSGTTNAELCLKVVEEDGTIAVHRIVMVDIVFMDTDFDYGN